MTIGAACLVLRIQSSIKIFECPDMYRGYAFINIACKFEMAGC